MWRLNSRTAVKWMTFFAIVQLPLYFVFMPDQQRQRRRRANTVTTTSGNLESCHGLHAYHLNEQQQQQQQQQARPPKAIRQLHRLRSLAVKYNRFFLINYTITFVRATLIYLMGMGLLRDYHLADCFIMGRTILFGKTHRFSAIFTPLFYIMYAVYRNYLGKCRPGFKFQAIEFILHDYDEILAHEALECKTFRRTDGAPTEKRRDYQRAVEYESDQYQSQLGVGRNGSRDFHAAGAPTGGHRRRRAISLGKRPTAAQLGLEMSSEQAAVRHHHLDDMRLQWCNRVRSPQEANRAHDDWLPSKSPLLYIRSTFVNENIDKFGDEFGELGASKSDDEYILRLNRTTKCWSTLNRFTLIALILSLSGFLNFVFLSMLIFLGPLTTEFGFETSYSSCVRYLKRVQQATRQTNASTSPQLPYASSIYLAVNRSLSCDIRLDDMPLFYLPGGEYKTINLASLYHVVRITFDLYESYLFNLGFVCYLSAISFTIFILALDVVLNAREITKRMVVIVDQLRNWRESQEPISGSAGGHLLIMPLIRPNERHDQHQHQHQHAYKLARHSCRSTTKQLRRDILIIQEILVDHFKLVGQYNSYVSLTLILTLMLLLCISLAFMVIIFTYKSSGIAFEYFVGELGSIVLLIYLFTGVAITRALNVRLHSLITRAMALDCSQSATKLRWALIMKHYHPKPLYCFTLLERTELSWLFCLKFAAWSLSAVFVLAGFLYPR